jgi:hypothetical protein
MLNKNFFDALNQLDQLTELVIVDCSTELPEVPMDHFELIDREGAKKMAVRPFKGVCKKLKSIKILKSHPRIFNYVVTEEWKALSSLRVDVYFTTEGFTTFVLPTNGVESFPALADASVGISKNFRKRAHDIIKLAKERHPEIIGKVRFVQVGGDIEQ